jgi:hypothetical protein
MADVSARLTSTARVSTCEAVLLAESVTVAVNVVTAAEPETVPLITPELSVAQPGSDPEVTAQVYPPAPPVAARVAE